MKVLADLPFSVVSLLGLQMATFFLATLFALSSRVCGCSPLVTVCPITSYKDTHYTGVEPTLWSRFKGLISKYS